MCIRDSANGVFQLGECLCEDGARRCHVHSHEAFATLAEHLSVVEGETCLVDKEVDEPVVIETELAAVEPHQK